MNSFITQIFKHGKSPEKSSPGPAKYETQTTWAKTSLKAAQRVKGGEKQKEERTTFMVEKISLANNVPGPIYPMANPVSQTHFIYIELMF